MKRGDSKILGEGDLVQFCLRQSTSQAGIDVDMKTGEIKSNLRKTKEVLKKIPKTPST